MLQLEVAELDRQKVEIADEKDSRERELLDALAPKITNLKAAVEELTEDIEKSKQTIFKLGTSRSQGVDEIAKVLSCELHRDGRSLRLPSTHSSRKRTATERLHFAIKRTSPSSGLGRIGCV